MSRILTEACPVARMARIVPAAVAVVESGVSRASGSSGGRTFQSGPQPQAAPGATRPGRTGKSILRKDRIRAYGQTACDAETRYDYATFDAGICAVAGDLALSPGTRVALCAPPSFAYLCLLFAAWRQGGLVFPLSPRLPAAGLAAVLAEAGVTQLFTDGNPVEIEGVEVFDIGRASRSIRRSGIPARPADAQALEGTRGQAGMPDHLQGREPEAAGAVTRPFDFEAPAVGLQTSGTTAAGKLVVHSLSTLGYNAIGANETMPLAPGDRWLLSLPLYHVSGIGIVMRAALAGACVVIDATRGLDDAIRHHGVTHVSVVHTQLARLVASSEAADAVTGLKGLLAGGSSLPRDLLTRARAAGLPLHVTYGSTEMGSQITTTSDPGVEDGAALSGTPLPHRQVKISADGEILVRGKTLCLGYLDDGAILPCTDAQGWFHTGDMGSLTTEGELAVMGRRDSMFISGGENIYPEEVEAALLDLPGVIAAGIVPVPDAAYGARPVAVVAWHGGRTLDEPAIREALRERLPGFKIPDRVLPWPGDYPADGLKLDRGWLRRYVERVMR